MAVEFSATPQRDEGTGKAKQNDKPVTVTSLHHEEGPTGFAKQQPDEVVYVSEPHGEKPTGKAKQQEEPQTYVTDFPVQKKAKNAPQEDVKKRVSEAEIDPPYKAKRVSAVEDKAVHKSKSKKE